MLHFKSKITYQKTRLFLLTYYLKTITRSARVISKTHMFVRKIKHIYFMQIFTPDRVKNNFANDLY